MSLQGLGCAKTFGDLAPGGGPEQTGEFAVSFASFLDLDFPNPLVAADWQSERILGRFSAWSAANFARNAAIRGLDADDVHDPGEIVRQYGECHLGADILQPLHQKVGCAHAHLDAAKGMLDRLEALTHRLRVLVEPSLHVFDQRPPVCLLWETNDSVWLAGTGITISLKSPSNIVNGSRKAVHAPGTDLQCHSPGGRASKSRH